MMIIELTSCDGIVAVNFQNVTYMQFAPDGTMIRFTNGVCLFVKEKREHIIGEINALQRNKYMQGYKYTSKVLKCVTMRLNAFK